MHITAPERFCHASSMMNVRYATQHDLTFVAQDEYVPVHTVARKIEEREVLVAERDSVLAGYLRIEHLWSRLPYITLIRVLPDFRRRGVGRALLGFLEDQLRAAGYVVLLSSSQADELEPQAWHRHMGFVECGRLEGINEGGVDEVFFRKQLQTAADSLNKAASY
jgi:ribosomal protein S18 acetylase RimI-like enzyme